MSIDMFVLTYPSATQEEVARFESYLALSCDDCGGEHEAGTPECPFEK